MPEAALAHSATLQKAFADYERQVTIHNYQIGCILGIIFMPAGYTLDSYVYPLLAGNFFGMRLLCSLLLAGVWLMLRTPRGTRHYRLLGTIEVSLPLFFISCMIYATEGSASPYYAGLNLVIMGAGIVLRWTLRDSITVLFLALAMYLTACVCNGKWDYPGLFFNNLYFLLVTGVFIITGNYFYTRIRFREFALRFELDQNRKMLEESNEKLVELDRVKSRFFANISHELRTPLTLLLAPLESLLRQPGFSDQAQEWLRTMQAHGMRLLKLINDLLELVRLESGRIELKREPVEMRQFLKGLGQSVRKMVEDKRVALNLDVAEDVGSLMVDRDKLEKVVLNLLFNAIKFTPAGGRVEVRAVHHDANLELQVQDTGMGIADKQLPFLFKRFWQADSSSQRKYQGAGIGLALVKELVEAHGGTVSATSQVGVGTTMTVRIPWLQAHPVSEQVDSTLPDSALRPPTSALPGEEWLAGLYRRAELFPSLTSLQDSMRPVEIPSLNSRPRVLVADDEPDMLRFLRSQLSPHFQVLEAVDGQQAIEKAAQFLPDIVLCDMMMPEKDGLQVCRELRERTPTQNIPVVLLTARADEETKLTALNAGASDFLTKPFSTTELHVRLSNLVASHQLQRKLARQNQALEATLEQLKETETQLVQSEKLASLGRMSAGIIHEINNPLNFVKTGLCCLRPLEDKLPDTSKADFLEMLGDIENGINRVQTIVSDLRVFTRPDSAQKEEVPVEILVTSALRLLSHEYHGQVQIEKQIPPEHTLWVNQNRLTQVLVNLFHNALHAMKQKSYQDDQPTLKIESRPETRRHLLVIRDNGTGIASEHLDKIFEPFFTTKEVGQGMGLGLSICYRIMAEHDGRILVKSEPGHFCEFTLEFPKKMSS